MPALRQQMTLIAFEAQFASRMVESFYTGWTLITSLLIGVVTVWPLLIFGSVAWWAVRRWRRSLA